ncbi:MAG: adenylate/guanylate cyclase domain-containing protein [Nitrospinae bacterium]|nr:adenylate/guanylate cyclase domain-containing protein [Nitrospinota bacterium]
MPRKWMNSFTASLLLTAVSLYLYSLDLPFFRLLELKAYDVKMTARGARAVGGQRDAGPNGLGFDGEQADRKATRAEPVASGRLPGQVAIVAIDEKSLAKEGRWPWPRAVMAGLLDRIALSGAAVVGFDIFFPERETSVPIDALRRVFVENAPATVRREDLPRLLEGAADGDRRLAEAIERSQRSVLAYFVYPETDKAGSSAETMGDTHFELLDFSQYSIVQRSDSPAQPAPLRPMVAVGMSLPEFMRAANAAGFASFIPGPDGVIRWVPMALRFKDAIFPPLSLQMIQQATRLPLAARIVPYGVDQIKAGDLAVPVAENGDYLVNFYGPAYTFRHYPATDVLSGKIGAAELKDKFVLIGATAAGTHDMHTTPFGPLYPGVEVHATVIENLFQGDFLKRPEWFRVLDLAMIVGSGLALGAAALFLRALTLALVLVLFVLGYLYADYRLFARMGFWVNTVYPLFTQILVFTGLAVYRFAFEEREKRFIKQAFGQYLAPAVVERLVNNPSLLKLGGEKKVMTAFFSDVAGFSTISEKLSPERLVELLNVYLTEMTDIIVAYEGTVDKFEGDAIIAFFGAPVPRADHARRACWVSLDMQNRLTALRERWRSEGKHELFARIGLNTGPMVVGNMGSKTRMDYTMMGDSVNLASRLEGVNKQYGTYIMISEFTYEQARDFIEVRELDLIRVVGKKEPIRIYEVLGRKGEISGPMRNALPIFARGLQHYRRMEWAAAMACFEKVLEIHEKDGPALTFFQRCMLFKENPPPDGWDGIFTMTSK